MVGIQPSPCRSWWRDDSSELSSMVDASPSQRASQYSHTGSDDSGGRGFGKPLVDAEAAGYTTTYCTRDLARTY